MEYFDNKVQRVQNSARTPEQKETSARYMELYREWIRYENADTPRTKVHFLAACLWAVVGIPALILIINFLIEKL